MFHNLLYAYQRVPSARLIKWIDSDNVGKPTINLPVADGFNPFRNVILGGLLPRVYQINPNGNYKKRLEKSATIIGPL